MNTNKKTQFIAFSSQKGGVGKSSFTILAASILHYRLGYNVVVVDSDFPQHSLTKMRNRDLEIVKSNEILKRLAYKQFTTINKKAYPILQHKAEKAIDAANKFVNDSQVPIDIVFFDLPGTVNSPGILQALASMNHIFTPLIADRVVMESALVFTKILKDVIMKDSHTEIQSLNLFWNQVDGREKTPLYEVYNNLIAELGFSLMKGEVKNSTRFRKGSEENTKDVFRSTILPADERQMKLCQFDTFFEEFLSIINF